MNNDMLRARALKVLPLTERNGAPRHEDEKIRTIVQAAVEQALESRDSKVLSEMRDINRNLERSVNRLLENIDGLVRGEHDLAIAQVVDSEFDDLPRLSSAKADATVIYTVRASQIAAELGLSTGAVSFLLNSAGLDWVVRKPELWNAELYKVSGARLWHRSVVARLREVICDTDHIERAGIGAACARALERASALIAA